MQPILIFTGSFNPPTTAHRLILDTLRQKLAGVPCVVMPAPATAHKPAQQLAPFEHRLQMCRLAFGDLPDTTISDFAASVPSVQSIDLIEAWRRQSAPAVPHIIWVMGADSFVSLPQWHRWREVIGAIALYVLARDGSDIAACAAAHEFMALRARAPSETADRVCWYVDHDFANNGSATAARAGDTRLLAPAVYDYLNQHKLYQ